jgi:predicted kinase
MATSAATEDPVAVEGSAIEGDFDKEPCMVVLAGLPGCGKSHFCYELFEEQSVLSPWVHVCQDTLGSRHACEQSVKEALISGRRVVIDR